MPKTRKKKCKFCGIWFMPCPLAGNRQISCGAPACVKARKAYSHQAWVRDHPDYYKGRYHTSTKPWLDAHPGYQREYRKNNPDKAAQNREQQKKRDKNRPKRNLDIQDLALVQAIEKTEDIYKLTDLDIQDSAIAYPLLFIGLMSCLRNLDKQNIIDISLHSIYNRGRFLARQYSDL